MRIRTTPGTLRLRPRPSVRVWRRWLALTSAMCITVGIGGVATAAGASNLCGSTVTSDLKLTQDLRCSGSGLTVAGTAPVRIDLNGHTISGGGIGVDSSAAVTIVNGTLRGGGIGGQRGDIRIDRVTITGAATPLFIGPDGRMSFARGRLNGPGVVGIRSGSGPQLGVLDVSDSQIRDMTFNFGVAGGGHRFMNNTFTGGSNIRAVEVDGFAISGNRFSDAGTAVFLDISFGNVITGNRFTGNEVGLSLNEAWGAVVADNVFANNRGVGARIVGPTGRPYTITGNRFVGNGASGLYLVGPYVTGSVSGNTFTGNGFHPGTSTDQAGMPLTAGAVIVPDGPPSGTTVSANVATLNAGLGIKASNVIDGGGNRARLNGDRQQCAGVTCG